MVRPTKRTLAIVAGIAALALLGAVLLPRLLDVDRYKPRIESGASKALGLVVRIDGRIRLAILPRPHLSVEGGRILDAHGTAVVRVKRVHLSFGFLPLLRGKVRIRSIELTEPDVSIERSLDRRFNIENLMRSSALLAALDGGRLSIEHGTIHYADLRSNDGFDATRIELSARHIRILPGKDRGAADRRSIEADLACGEFRTKRLAVTGLKAAIVGRNGIFEATPITMRLFGGEATARVRADFSGAVPRYQVRFALPRLRIEEFFKLLSPDKAGEGEMDFTANVSLQGKLGPQIVQTLEGEISLRGSNLTLFGHDLDQALDRFESSQSFNLVDVGAVFLAGPLGLAVTKGYSFASLFRGTGGSTRIGVLVSDWRVDHGVARARDVAMTTKENRIALQGGLDLAQERFENVTVAVVNPAGCATLKQEIEGSFSSPKVEKPKFFKSISAPVRKIFKQARGVFPEKPCEVFYAGTVAPPP